MAGSDSLSGSWTGRFDYDNITHGTPVSFDAVLIETGSTLRGEIVEPNTFRPEATDTLLSVLTGTRSGSNVSFVKTYTDFEDTDHPHYEGQINATATRITGRWHFPSMSGIKGTFLLARTAEAAVRKKAAAAVEMVFED
ncbi:hypothetical protein [Octadecabacter ascidiaceicola]|uniref:Uncharacterized protein n=1 Tax=Octadecabacter ascidiaceicola TaxID=1655543 RepID=A0A238KG30_9RHOB|nr:hypothetical protein [Octadecabacter ascidiaceicola]SMX41795.1 hypothetical protein OCA8868_02587 [Octadecabacter ascidiaceicola]